MVESWRQLMDVGLIHFMAYPNATEPPAVQETVRKLAQDDFWDVLEIKRVDEPGVHDELRAIAEQSGISYGMAAQPNLLGGKLSLNDPDEPGRQAAIDEV
ncbi:MAG: sugar phosphate isomerase/epimerase, partial [Armatimonadetes bacterium]|nr:sugar phosphate isomerase/epimerase [Armatimonadota bacterium]